jgi:hypothetical protein
MDPSAIERTIVECGVPARLVAVEGGVIELQMLDAGGFPRGVSRFSFSEFCDLALDCRARRTSTTLRALVASAA